MKPKVRLLFSFFLCSISSILIAQPVNIHTAKTIAEHHLASIDKPTLKSTSINRSTFHFTSVKAAVENKDTLYYILNDTINKSFVIVSADQRIWPILGYSTEESFDEKKQPQAFIDWMDNRKKEIEYIKNNNIQANSATKAKWQNLSLKSSTIETTSVEPLIQTKWDQGCFYNAMCPADVAGPCGQVYTGCTITAMAQIMKYWNYPTKGTGSHSYDHPTYGNLSADFGSTTYQWSQMPNSVNSENDAVATLMYHCGVSLETDYGTSGSGASDPRDELVQYFNYSSNVVMANKSGFNTSEWINLLKSELDFGHPIWYMGGSSTPHSFICDGYQNEEYFHFNWGWGGSSDGYFYLGNLNPGWYNFSEDQFAIINLVPGNLPDGYNGFFLSSNAIDIASKGGTASVDICSSANWTASSDQTWFSLSTSSGVSGKTTLTLTASENQTGSDRSDTVTISSPGFGDQIIIVYQLAAVCVTPGSLYSSISEKATSISKLTLTGTIDARDFKTMRDAMPALTDVDLSDVTIVAYSGYEGTANAPFDYPANEIPYNAFYIIPCRGQNFLKSITLPATITSIGMQAFGNSQYLSTINISSTVNSIAARAFEICAAFINVDSNNPNYSSVDGVLFNKNKTKIIHYPVSKTGNYTIPASVNSIEPRAFWECTKLESVTIPPSVNSIGDCAFWESEGLTNVNIPPSVTSIGDCAFWSCTSLANINIPSSVTSIGDAAFGSSSGLINVEADNSKYSSIDGVLFNKTQTELIHCPTSINGSYIIPSSVTSIGNSAFSNCYGLTSMEIPTSVISIGSTAFIECSNLISVTIPSSIISIGSQAFWGCFRLKSIYSYNTSPQSLINSSNVFNLVNKNTCTLYVPFGCKTQYDTSKQWEDFVNIVEMPGIFFSMNSLGIDSKGGTAQVAISSSTDWSATSDQTWLTVNPSVGLAGIDTITFSTLANPTESMRTAVVRISAKDIDPQTITVTQLGKVEVTAGNLQTILAGQLSSIKHLTLTGTIDARDFKTMRDEMPALSDINLDDVTIVAYSGTEGTGGEWTTYYPANGIPNHAFCLKSTKQGKATLNSISLPSSVNIIEESAFENCMGLKNINFPPSVIYIGESAFSYCFNIANINIPSSVTSIGRGAFVRINVLINVDADNNYYSSIDGVLFNKTQTELIQCPTSKNGSYIVPSSVSSIGRAAFNFCSGLTNVTIPASVTSIGYATFAKCDGLTSMKLPSSIISLGWYAFAECSQLTTITIPSSIITIDIGAFLGCKGLRSIYVFKKPPPSLDISSNVFGLVDKNTCTLYVPFGSKTLYATAPLWKDFVNIIELPNQAPPFANAGTDQSVNENLQFSLDGSASSDPDGDPLTYKWTAPAEITLTTTLAKPTFIAPEVATDTDYTFSLIVNDGTIDSQTDQVVITVKNVNKPPVANTSSNQTVNEGEKVTLYGSASSDPDGDPITYKWTAPAEITLSSTTISKPNFIAPEINTDTDYIFSLVVNDGTIDSQTDQVVITVKNVNKSPVANISSNQTVNEGETVTLDGSASSDPDGDPLTYKWTAPAEITLSSITLAKPTFIAPEVTTDTDYIFSLVVNDGTVDSPTNQVAVTVLNLSNTGIHERNGSNKLLIYPNPTSGSLEISIEEWQENNYNIEVYNSIGQLKLATIISKEEKVSKIDLSTFTNGLYLIKVSSKNQNYQKKIIKK
ncbi:MAG: leucine-rich repeat protein [Bacteroidales bacterium]|nr:leucine-rich repeat protein [Bacteroidales bacterium]